MQFDTAPSHSHEQPPYGPEKELNIEGNRLDVLFVLLHLNLFVFSLLPRLRLATLESEKEEMLHEVRQLRKMGQAGDLPRDLVRHS